MTAGPERQPLPKLAYTLEEFAEVVSLSKSSVRKLISENELVVSYVKYKPLITHEEALRWLRSLPNESPR